MKKLQIYTPDNDRILIRQFEAETTSSGGIIIPDTARERPQKGIIVRKGPDVDPIWEEGEMILYGKYAGTEITVNNKEFLILRQNDLHGHWLEQEVSEEDFDNFDIGMMAPKKIIHPKDKGKSAPVRR